MKRVTVLFLCVAFLLFPVYAENDPNLNWKMPEHLPQVGEQFEVCLTIHNNPGINTLQFTLCWNKDVIEYVDAEKGEVIQNFIFAKNLTEGGKAIVAAASVDGTEQNGKVVIFRFIVIGNGIASFNISDIQVSDRFGNSVPLPIMSFTLSAEGRSENSISYLDVPATHWAYKAVISASDAGWVNGYENGCFRPEKLVTRAEFAVTLWRFAGYPEPAVSADFMDINESAWYAKAVAWAREKGYMKGTSDTLFSPEDTLSREQAVTVFYRMNGGVQGMEVLFSGIYDSQFEDRGQASEWAIPAIDWAVFNGIITGETETQIQPKAFLSRAQMVTLVWRCYGE